MRSTTWLASALVLAALLPSSAAQADSFQSTPRLDDGAPSTGERPSDACWTAADLLRAMDWRSWGERGPYAAAGLPQGGQPARALAWVVERRACAPPALRFLVPYRAVFDVTEPAMAADLLAELRRAQADVTIGGGGDPAILAVMALGASLAELQVEIFGVSTDLALWDAVTPPKHAAAGSFGEAIALARSLGEERAAERARIALALSEAWAYMRIYPGVEAAITASVPPEALAWLPQPEGR